MKERFFLGGGGQEFATIAELLCVHFLVQSVTQEDEIISGWICLSSDFMIINVTIGRVAVIFMP